jgi:hypothetical protein
VGVGRRGRLPSDHRPPGPAAPSRSETAECLPAGHHPRASPPCCTLLTRAPFPGTPAGAAFLAGRLDAERYAHARAERNREAHDLAEDSSRRRAILDAEYARVLAEVLKLARLRGFGAGTETQTYGEVDNRSSGRIALSQVTSPAAGCCPDLGRSRVRRRDRAGGDAVAPRSSGHALSSPRYGMSADCAIAFRTSSGVSSCGMCPVPGSTCRRAPWMAPASARP